MSSATPDARTGRRRASVREQMATDAPGEIEEAVPLRSQKDRALFLGGNGRESRVRAKDRTKEHGPDHGNARSDTAS